MKAGVFVLCGGLLGLLFVAGVESRELERCVGWREGGEAEMENYMLLVYVAVALTGSSFTVFLLHMSDL